MVLSSITINYLLLCIQINNVRITKISKNVGVGCEFCVFDLGVDGAGWFRMCRVWEVRLPFYIFAELSSERGEVVTIYTPAKTSTEAKSFDHIKLS